MAQNGTPRAITDLPPELLLRICELLDAPDLVNFCISVSEWKWILSTRRFSTVMHQYIKQWTWLDKYLCQLVFPQSSQISFRKASDAIQYQAQQTDFCQSLLSTLPQDQVHRTIRFRLLPFFNINRMSYCECIQQMESPRVEACKDIPLSRYPLSIRFARATNFDIVGDRHEGGLDYLILRSAYAADDEEKCDNCDCIICFVYRCLFPKDELRATIEGLAPNQTLIIALVVNAKKDKSSEMECFARFIHKIGEFYNFLLSAPPTNWRLWCIRREDENFINWSELLEWACYDAISKQRQDFRDGYLGIWPEESARV